MSGTCAPQKGICAHILPVDLLGKNIKIEAGASKNFTELKRKDFLEISNQNTEVP